MQVLDGFGPAVSSTTPGNPRTLLTKIILPKLERVAVLRDVALDLLRDTIGDVGPDLKRHPDVRAQDRSQPLHDLLADGPRAPAKPHWALISSSGSATSMSFLR